MPPYHAPRIPQLFLFRYIACQQLAITLLHLVQGQARSSKYHAIFLIWFLACWVAWFGLLWSSGVSLIDGVMAPQPRMIPRVISGQRFGVCGQRASACCQSIFRGIAWHWVSICSMDSVTPHVVQNSHCSVFSRCCQYFLVFWVPCMALYMNCWTCVLKVHHHIPDQRVSSVSRRLL